MPEAAAATEPSRDCPDCPRLVAFRLEHRARFPDWFNAPVPSFTSDRPVLMVVGLAPGLRGANRTGRPFTGDYAGDLLYETMIDFGFATGSYQARPDDGLTLNGAMITNAVRCVPPENKPTGPEINACRPYLVATLEAATSVRAVLALGRIAHDTFLTTLGLPRSRHVFAHGARHDLTYNGRALMLFDSYHCSRYNTNTGRLTRDMFRDVFTSMKAALG